MHKMYLNAPPRRMSFPTAFAQVHAAQLEAHKIKLEVTQPDCVKLHHLALKQLVAEATNVQKAAANTLIADSVKDAASKEQP